MLEIGHEFSRNGINYCVVDIIDYNFKRYYFLSEEKKHKRMNFNFYECNITSNGDTELNIVKNDELISYLFILMEGRNNNE